MSLRIGEYINICKNENFLHIAENLHCKLLTVTSEIDAGSFQIGHPDLTPIPRMNTIYCNMDHVTEFQVVAYTMVASVVSMVMLQRGGGYTVINIADYDSDSSQYALYHNSCCNLDLSDALDAFVSQSIEQISVCTERKATAAMKPTISRMTVCNPYGNPTLI